MSSKKKELIDREITLYKKEQTLAVDREIHDKVVGNWNLVEKARYDRLKEETQMGIQTAELKAKKEALAEVNAIKDQEIALLKELLKEALKALQTVKVTA